MNLFLDDIRVPHDVSYYLKNHKDLKWVIVKSYDEFVKYITDNGMPRLISFDHDLSFEHYTVYDDDVKVEFKEKTGYDALKWVCNYTLENGLKLPKMKFHTANYVGLKNMITYLENFIKHNPEIEDE